LCNLYSQKFVLYFSDNYFHIGGDEVNARCWNGDPDIFAYLVAQNMTVQQLQGVFEVQALQYISTNGKQSVVWQEVFDTGSKLPNNTVVNVWQDEANITITAALQAGYRVVLSSGWYLDRMQPGLPHYQWVQTWFDFYNNEPTANTVLTPDQEALLLGGEISVWAESVDEINFDERVWTRAPSGAERLWSNKAINNVTLAQPRLEYFRCKLVQRGVRAGPTTYSYCMPLGGVRHPFPSPTPYDPFKTAAYIMSVLCGLFLITNIVSYFYMRRVQNDSNPAKRPLLPGFGS